MQLPAHPLDAGKVQLVSVPQHRHHQPLGRGNCNADVAVVAVDDVGALNHAVHLATTAQDRLHLLLSAGCLRTAVAHGYCGDLARGAPLTAGMAISASLLAFTNADMKPSFTPCFSRNASCEYIAVQSTQVLNMLPRVGSSPYLRCRACKDLAAADVQLAGASNSTEETLSARLLDKYRSELRPAPCSQSAAA
jgi:hypothetical protein